MRPPSKESGGCFSLRIPLFRRRKVPKEEVRLAQTFRDGPTPTPAAEALELQLTEEKGKYARLEQELQRVAAETEAFTQAKRKLENEARQAKEFSETREKEAEHKDAEIRRLEKDVGEMQKKVGQLGRGTSSSD